MRATRSFLFGFSWCLGLRSAAFTIAACSLPACTLITDIDREKIPQPMTPTFPEVDAGPQPGEQVPDAGEPDASVPPPDAASDAGTDEGLDAGAAGDGGDAGDGG